jgi:DNA polymerase III sliding clamp (beta) subunit (PCNA family)
MSDLLDLVEMQHDDPEMVPDIVPVEAVLSVKGPASALIGMFERAAGISPLPTKEVYPDTAYARFEAIGAGSVSAHCRITASDGEQTVSVVAGGVVVSMAGETLIQPRKVLDILKLVPTSVVKIEVLGAAATIRAGQAQWTVAAPLDARLAVAPDLGSIEMHSVLRQEFLEALTVTRRSVATTAARPALQQALVRNQTITSCDGGRVHRQRLEIDPDLDFTLPVSVMDELIRAMRSSDVEGIGVGITPRHLAFQIDEDTIIAQRLTLAFPGDPEALINRAAFSNQWVLDMDRDELAQIVRRVRVNADPDFPGIYLGIQPIDGGTRLVVRARDRNGNAAQETTVCSWSGPAKAREICLNHRYLSDLLASSPSTVEIRIGEDTKTMKNAILVEDMLSGFVGAVSQIRPSESLR